MNTPWTQEEIRQFENVFNVKCTLRPDGMYDVKGHIYIVNRGLMNLSVVPPIHTLTGSFVCSHNFLVNLEGSPKQVMENFICHNNKLKTLDGGPEWVGKHFNCSINPDLKFTESALNALNIAGHKQYDPEQLIPEDPSVYIENGLLPI